MTSTNVIFGNAMLLKMQQEFPDKIFRLSKKGAVNYQTSSGRWLACCIHGSQVAACRKPGCENGDFCGCRGERGAQLVRSVCPKHNGASICQHGNRKNMCKVPPRRRNRISKAKPSAKRFTMPRRCKKFTKSAAATPTLDASFIMHEPQTREAV